MNILVMVSLLLLFGEVTPKTIAVSDPVKISTQIIAVPLGLWVRFITPFRWLDRRGYETGRILGADELLHYRSAYDNDRRCHAAVAGPAAAGRRRGCH